MFCGECGTANPDTNQFCKNCGKPLRRPQQAAAPAPAVSPPTAVPQPAAPAYYAPPPGVVQPPVPGTAQATAKPPLNKGMLVLGILAIIVGIGSWFRYPYLLGVLAIVLGGIVISRTKNKKSAIAIVAALGVLIGLASIIVDIFYLEIFPRAPGVLMTFWLIP
jgi:hypothetical protein